MASEQSATSADHIVTASGDLVKERAVEFQQALDAAAAGTAQKVVIDLSDVTTMSSACVGKILLCHHELHHVGRELMVKGVSEPVMEMFRLIRLDRLVTVLR